MSTIKEAFEAIYRDTGIFANLRWYIVFCISFVRGIRKIYKDKTILTLHFLLPIKIKIGNKIRYVDNYYETLFYLSDYDSILKDVVPHSLLIDVGAHFGGVTHRYLLKHEDMFALLFEPNINNIHIIHKLLKRDHIKNYKVYHMGLWDENKELELHLENPISCCWSFLEKEHEQSRCKIQVKKFDDVDIDNLFDFPNVFIKIDVEWYEVEVIKGMLKSLQALKAQNKWIRLFIEIKPEDNFKEIKKDLLSISKEMHIQKITDEDYLFIM